MYSTFRPLTPLSWGQPETPRDKRRSSATFKAHYNDTINMLDREISLLGANSFVVEADFREQDIRLDGVPRANARQPEFPGIRVSFDSKHGPLRYQTDTCQRWEHNLRSIALGLEALRAVDRYGVTARAEQYTGFKALGAGPTGDAKKEQAVAFIQRYSDPSVDLLTAVRQAKRLLHPNGGGDLETWHKFQDAARILGMES